MDGIDSEYPEPGRDTTLRNPYFAAANGQPFAHDDAVDDDVNFQIDDDSGQDVPMDDVLFPEDEEEDPEDFLDYYEDPPPPPDDNEEDVDFDPTADDMQIDDVDTDSPLSDDGIAPPTPSRRARGRGRGPGRPRGRGRPRKSAGTTRSDASHHVESGSRVGKPKGRPRGRGGRGGRARSQQDGDPAPFRGLRREIRQNSDPDGAKTRGRQKGAPKRRMPVSPEFSRMQAEATQALLAKDYDTVVAACIDAIKINPEVFASYSMLAEAKFAQGRTDEGLEHLFAGAFTTPRDPEVWRKVIISLDNHAHLFSADKIAAQKHECYGMILRVEPDDFKARSARLDAFVRTRHIASIISTCRHLLRHHPCDLDTLGTYSRFGPQKGLDFSARRAWKSAVDTIVRNDGVFSGRPFSWADLGSYINLLLQLGDFDEGISELKMVARWICGRRDETFWDSWQEDDREWDDEHEPRRSEIPDFKPGAFTVEQYGRSLPPSLRATLGVLRLFKGDKGEASHHFQAFPPHERGRDASVKRHPAAFREIADALFVKRQYSWAVEYYDAIFPGAHLHSQDFDRYRNYAKCLTELGRLDEAIAVYARLDERDVLSWQDRLALATLYEVRNEEGDDANASKQIYELLVLGCHRNVAAAGLRNAAFVKVRRSRFKREIDLASARRAGELALHDLAGDAGVPQSSVQLTANDPGRNQRVEEELSKKPIHENYKAFRACTERIVAGTSSDLSEWLSIAIVLTDKFLREHMLPDQAIKAELQGRNGVKAFIGVGYDEWIGLMCQTCLVLARYGQAEEAYNILARADRVPEFHRNDGFIQSRHLCEAACAWVDQNEDRLLLAMRWYVFAYGHLSETTGLYNLVLRAFPRQLTTYNRHGHQKFWHRHVRSLDFAVMDEPKRRAFQFTAAERASFARYPEYVTRPPGGTDFDPAGNPENLKDLDPTILTFYGGLLAANGSASNALNYLLRALQLRPKNPVLLLSIAAAYVQMSMKRTTENRHWMLLTGVGFMQEYEEQRMAEAESKPSIRGRATMEVAFNKGRLMHAVGLLHLAWPLYEKVLSTPDDERDKRDGMPQSSPGYKREAAFAMQSICWTAGDVQGAREIAEQHLRY